MSTSGMQYTFGLKINSWLQINGIELEWEKIENDFEVIAHARLCQDMYQGAGAP